MGKFLFGVAGGLALVLVVSIFFPEFGPPSFSQERPQAERAETPRPAAPPRIVPAAAEQKLAGPPEREEPAEARETRERELAGDPAEGRRRRPESTEHQPGTQRPECDPVFTITRAEPVPSTESERIRVREGIRRGLCGQGPVLLRTEGCARGGGYRVCWGPSPPVRENGEG